jgi:hypothetical protein
VSEQQNINFVTAGAVPAAVQQHWHGVTSLHAFLLTVSSHMHAS